MGCGHEVRGAYEQTQKTETIIDSILLDFRHRLFYAHLRS